MYKPGGTIKDALRRIERNEYVLPAIQRELVWHSDQIARLFDSLMQGYPFGTFLFWQVEPANSAQYRFYGFVRDYHQRDNPHCPDMGLLPNRPLTAVLDGQQRLTALNIGLRGSLAVKEPNKWWTSPNAFPQRFLFLNLLPKDTADEDGSVYQFDFLEASKAKPNGGGEVWFRVGDILQMSAGPDMLTALMSLGLRDNALSSAFTVLDRLYRVIHTDPLISYYEEPSQDLERVLNIFIRLNSGGTVLSYSDLLLSIAVAQWSKRDARKEIHSLVDELNDTGTGFNFSKDFVLKAGLMLTDIASVGFKVENFNRTNMEKLEANWPKVRRALLMTAQLTASFGMNGQTLRADSALLPIAYYIHGKNPSDNYVTHSHDSGDREAIRGWLIRSLLKASGIWGSGLDVLLTALRTTLQDEGYARFPVEALRRTMAQRGKTLTFEWEEIEELLNIEYGDKRLFVLLTLLYPFVDLRNQFHIDHVFPAARFTQRRLKKAGIPDDKIAIFHEKCNQLPNLQLLEGAFNNEKREKLPADWLKVTYRDPAAKAHYCEKYDLGTVPGIIEFETFWDARRERLKAKLQQLVDLS